MTSEPRVIAAPTILDVARRAGVSRTTVSRVLNEPDTVAPAARERVRQAAAELNYVPSLAARSLRSGRTGAIALLVGDIAQPFHGRLAKSVAHAADALEFSVLLCDLDHSEERLLNLLERMPKQGVDGVVIATGDDVSSHPVRAAIARVTGMGIPVLLTVPEPRLAEVTTVAADHREVGRRATQLLLAEGRQNVMLIVGRQVATVARALIAGYREAIQADDRAGGSPTIAGQTSESLVFEGAYTFEQSERVVTELLARGERLDGLVVATMPMALGAIRAIEGAGLSVPGDVSVVACEEVPLATQTEPAVTTVGFDADEQGAEILRMLTAAIREEPVHGRTLHPVVISRATSRPPAAL